MEDVDIVELYWQRNEQAITETDQKYGRYCHYIAYQILSDDMAADEVHSRFFSISAMAS